MECSGGLIGKGTSQSLIFWKDLFPPQILEMEFNPVYSASFFKTHSYTLSWFLNHFGPFFSHNFSLSQSRSLGGIDPTFYTWLCRARPPCASVSGSGSVLPRLLSPESRSLCQSSVSAAPRWAGSLHVECLAGPVLRRAGHLLPDRGGEAVHDGVSSLPFLPGAADASVL